MKDNKIKANIYLKSETKPLGKTASKISNNILKHKEELTLEDFAYKLSTEGMSTVLATYSNEYSNKTPKKAYEIEGQQLIALDFDNKDLIQYTLDDLEKDDFFKENAIFWYNTFSDAESELDKFRVIIKLNKVVESKDVIEAIYSKLLNMYPAADTSVSYSARMVYGSNRGYTEIDFNNELDVDNFLEGYQIVKKDKKRTPTSPKSKSSSLNVNVEFDKSILTEYSPLWQLLKANSLDLAKENLEMKLQIKGGKYANYSSLKNALDHIDMRYLLDLPDENTFFDIFHEEQTPSATVFPYTNDGLLETPIDLYKCHSVSSGFVGGNTLIISKLLKKGLMKTLKIMENILGVFVNVDSKIKDIVDETQLMLTTLNSPEFKITMPNSYKIFGKDLDIINAFFDIFHNNLIEDFSTNQVYIGHYHSLNGLSNDISHRLGRNITLNGLHKVIITMAIVGLVTKIADDEVPKYLLKTLNNKKIQEGYQYRTDVYINKGYDDDFLDYLEEITNKLAVVGYTKTAVSYDYFVRALGSNFEGLERAYPQKKKSQVGKTNPLTDIYLNQAVKFVDKWVKKRGYISELQLKVFLAKTNSATLMDADYRLKQMRIDLVQSYGFERVQLNKSMKETYDTSKDKYIKANGYPVVYTR